MEIEDYEFSKLFVDTFDKRIRNIIQEELSNRNIVVNCGVAKVISVNGNYAEVQIPGETTTLTKENDSGKTLSIGDEVYLYSPHGELSTAYIAKKKLKE